MCDFIILNVRNVIKLLYQDLVKGQLRNMFNRKNHYTNIITILPIRKTKKN